VLVLLGDRYMEEKQTELETENMKISNTADNADITQLHACDTRHRRLQEVNSFCTDSWPLRVEYCIVFIQHNTVISLPLLIISLLNLNMQDC